MKIVWSIGCSILQFALCFVALKIVGDSSGMASRSLGQIAGGVNCLFGNGVIVALDMIGNP